VLPAVIDRSNAALAEKVDRRDAIISELLDRRQMSFMFAPSFNAMIWGVGAVELQVAIQGYTDAYNKRHVAFGWSLATPTLVGEAGVGMLGHWKLQHAWGLELAGVQVARSPLYGHNVEVGLPGASVMLNDRGDIVIGGKMPIWGDLGPGLEIGIRHPKLRRFTRPVVAPVVRGADYIREKLTPVTSPIGQFGSKIKQTLTRSWTQTRRRLTANNPEAPQGTPAPTSADESVHARGSEASNRIAVLAHPSIAAGATPTPSEREPTLSRQSLRRRLLPRRATRSRS
jgi:hypothetical protein